MKQKFIKNHIFSLLIWLFIFIGALIFLPHTTNLVQQHANVQLSGNLPSEVAKKYGSFWPAKKNSYDVLLVFNKKRGRLNSVDEQALNEKIDSLKTHKADFGIKGILGPNDNVTSKKFLKSKDGTTWLVPLDIDKKHASLNEISNQLTRINQISGINTYATGSEILQAAYQSKIQQAAKIAIGVLIVLSLVILGLIFKTPVAPILSILTIAVALVSSTSLVLNLVKNYNLAFSSFTLLFMVLTLFVLGTGINYLIYNKFRQKLKAKKEVTIAAKLAIKETAKPILIVSGIVLLGFLLLAFAQYPLYQSLSWTAVGVAFLVAVLMSLNVFILATLGKKMFWPNRDGLANKEKLWSTLGRGAKSHPIISLLVLAIVIFPLSLMFSGHLNYDSNDGIADNVPAKAGLLAVQHHFPQGFAEPSYLFIKSKKPLDNEKDLNLIDGVTKKLQSDTAVSSVVSLTQPYGEVIEQFYVKNQLSDVNSGLDTARTTLGSLHKKSKGITKAASKIRTNSSQIAEKTDSLKKNATGLESASESFSNDLQKLNAQLNNLQSQQSASLNQLQSSYQNRLVKKVNRIRGLTSKQKSAVLKAATSALAVPVSQLANNNLYAQLQPLNTLNQIQSKTTAINNELSQVHPAVDKLNSANGKISRANPEVTSGLNFVNNNLGQRQGYLSGLRNSQAADSYYVPKEYLKSVAFKEPLKTYLSPDKKIAVLVIIFNNKPGVSQLTNKSEKLTMMVKDSLVGTNLNKADVVIGGQNTQIADSRKLADSDFIKLAIVLLLVGSLLLIIISKSLSMTLCIVLSMVASYLSSLTINQWLAQLLFHQKNLGWNVPFLSFILLTIFGFSVGAFLSTSYCKFKEFAPSQRLPKIYQKIGLLVIFLALMLMLALGSLTFIGMPDITELALVIIVGLLFLIIVLPLILSAVTRIFTLNKHKGISKS